MHHSGCSDGDVRLMGGANSLEGRVEICQSNVYSTVCDDFWDELEARVVCAQLGYTGEGRKNTLEKIYIHAGSWVLLFTSLMLIPDSQCMRNDCHSLVFIK